MWFVVTSMLLLSHISHVQLCDPMGCSPPGSSIHEILQARILEWVTMPSSRGSSQPRDQTQVSCIAGRFFTTGLPGKTSHFHAMCLVMSESLQPPELPPGYSLHGIFQARILEWVTIPFSRGSSQPRNCTWVSCVSCVSCSAGWVFTILVTMEVLSLPCIDISKLIPAIPNIRMAFRNPLITVQTNPMSGYKGAGPDVSPYLWIKWWRILLTVPLALCPLGLYSYYFSYPALPTYFLQWKSYKRSAQMSSPQWSLPKYRVNISICFSFFYVCLYLKTNKH